MSKPMILNNDGELIIGDTKNLSNFVVSLWDDEWLNEITSNSGKLANSNEYQVHYWALVMTKRFEDNSKVSISIPLVIYNYPQEVTSASINFELKDVEKISDKTRELAISRANEIYKYFKDEFSEYEITPLNSLHKHP